MSKKPTRLPPLDLNQRYDMRETAAYLRISHQTLYTKIRAGLIRTITDGSRRYAPGTEIARLSSLPP